MKEKHTGVVNCLSSYSSLMCTTKKNIIVFDSLSYLYTTGTNCILEVLRHAVYTTHTCMYHTSYKFIIYLKYLLRRVACRTRSIIK